jgi:hypothetical protein
MGGDSSITDDPMEQSAMLDEMANYFYLTVRLLGALVIVYMGSFASR